MCNQERLSLLLVPKHCIPHHPKLVQIAHFTPVSHTPQISFFVPHTQVSAHRSWTLRHMSGLRSSPVRRSLAVRRCLLELVPPPMRSLDVVFYRGSGGAGGSSKSASSSISVPAPGVYCNDGVKRSPADVNMDVELLFFESGWTERRSVRFKGW